MGVAADAAGPAPYGLSPASGSQAEPLVPNAKQIHVLQHSLGLTYGRDEYRNHFVTGEGSVDYADCMALVDAGLMERRGFSALTGGDWCFTVTEAGKVVAHDALPKLTKAQERYRRYLDVCDATGETFGQFLKRVSAQAVEAPSGGEMRSGSTVGESAVPEGMRP